MSKKLDIIKSEYELYEKECLGDADFATMEIIDLGSIVASGVYTYTDICKANGTKAKISKILGSYATDFGYRRPSYYESDSDVVGRHLIVCESYLGCFNILFIEIDESNYLEIYRLATFAYGYYMADMASLEKERTFNKMKLEGIFSERDFEEPNTASFMEFFEEVIEDAVKSDVVVMEKK